MKKPTRAVKTLNNTLTVHVKPRTLKAHLTAKAFESAIDKNTEDDRIVNQMIICSSVVALVDNIEVHDDDIFELQALAAWWKVANGNDDFKAVWEAWQEYITFDVSFALYDAVYAIDPRLKAESGLDVTNEEAEQDPN